MNIIYPIISIVIPVYNASNYISKCLDSIINQEFNYTLEIVCVNDGSKDDSLEILKSYASKFSYIKIIDQPNKGVTAARRAGVEAANGEWITFVDADDSLPPDALRHLFAFKSDEFDIVVGEPFYESKPRIEQIDSYRLGLMKGKVSTGPWAKLFRRKLFNNEILDIPREIFYGEDMLMNIRLSFQTEKPVFFIGKKVYIYNAVSSSISHKFVKTTDYEEKFHDLLLQSVPKRFRNEITYKHARIATKINAWKCLNFFKLSTKKLRNTSFYNSLVKDIRDNEYPIKIDEWIQVYGNNIMFRFIAIGLNLWPVCIYKVRKLFDCK